MQFEANTDRDRFREGAHEYAAYLATPDGRLRSDLAFAGVREFLPLADSARPLRALDIGSGTGAMSVRLALLGMRVTLLDSSPAMLELAGRAAREAGVAAQILPKEGDVAQLPDLFPTESFDVILCHNVLEFVDDPCAVLCAAAQMLANSSAILSVLVRNQAGAVLRAAIQAGDLDAAETALTAEWGRESLYGGTVRLFTPDSLEAMLKAAALAVAARRGVRVLSDYLPPAVSRTEDYDRILALERKLGSRPDLAAVARYTHCLARRGIGNRP